MSAAHRMFATAAAVLLAVLALAPSAQAAPVSAPACATTPTTATWTTHYEGDHYELATVALTGLAGCTGADLIVGIGSEQQLLAEIPVTVPAGALTVDVSEHGIPAQQVERITLTLRTTVPVAPTTEPTTESGTDSSPGSGIAGTEGTGSGTESPAPLPSTGVTIAWSAAIAATLVLIGAALRRRTQEASRG